MRFQRRLIGNDCYSHAVGNGETHPDVLEQAIDYQVPPDKFDKLAQYHGSGNVERSKGEISAHCDKEGANFLAINLTHEIVIDQHDLDSAC